MDSLQILFFAVFGAATLAGIYIIATKPTIGNARVAAVMCAIFSAYTAVQLYREGAMMFFTNHSGNLTGIQVWWDLVMSVLIAFFFIRPRACWGSPSPARLFRLPPSCFSVAAPTLIARRKAGPQSVRARRRQPK